MDNYEERTSEVFDVRMMPLEERDNLCCGLGSITAAQFDEFEKAREDAIRLAGITANKLAKLEVLEYNWVNLKDKIEQAIYLLKKSSDKDDVRDELAKYLHATSNWAHNVDDALNSIKEDCE